MTNSTCGDVAGLRNNVTLGQCASCDAPGAAEWIHPWVGEMDVDKWVRRGGGGGGGEWCVGLYGGPRDDY